MESFCWKNSRKTLNESAVITEVLCQMCHTKWESTEWTSPECFFYFPCQKSEALRTRFNGNKINWTETFVRSKQVAKWKTTLNLGTLACYENLPIKTHLKKACNLFLRVSPFPQISRFRSLHRLSSNNSENTNHRHLPLTGTDHCNSWLLKIFTFKETITHFRTIIFSQSPRFQFSSPILDGLSVFFNAHHFFMRKQFMCVDCYTGRLTFSNIIYTREQPDEYRLSVKLKWGRTNVCQKL